MSMATFCMSLTKMENLSDPTLVEMYRRNEEMIMGNYDLSLNSSFIGRRARKELDKLEYHQRRVSAEMQRRGLAV
jgi:hypothetical protein